MQCSFEPAGGAATQEAGEIRSTGARGRGDEMTVIYRMVKESLPSKGIFEQSLQERKG